MNQAPGNNPLDMLQSMWNQMGFQLPGMVTPTLDEGELDKQIRDLKSVENWLRMNLSMLQMTIQNLEMQKSALGTFRSMSAHFSNAASGEGASSASEQPPSSGNPFFQAAGFTAPSQATPDPAPTPEPNALSANDADEAALAKAAMWPWEMMNELNATMQAQLADANRQKSRVKTKDAAKKTAKPAAKKAVKKPSAPRK